MESLAQTGSEPICLTKLSETQRKRSNSVTSSSTVRSDVSFRSGGRVQVLKSKKKIPELHKTILAAVVISLLLVTPFLIYTMAYGKESGFFLSKPHMTVEEEDEFEHEREITWNGHDIAGFTLASLLIMIAAGGGIGGGGVLVPTYIFVLNFSPKYAIPLSNCTILGSSISNLILNVNKRHPNCDRPLIDWDIMLMMEPLTVAGALVGTFVNVISPPWLITIMLVVLLTAAAYRTLNKGVRKFKEETLARETEASNIKMDSNPRKVSNGYHALPDSTDDKRHPDQTHNGQNAQTVLNWSPTEVKEWWSRSLPPGCQDYIHIVDECELDGADLLDLDYISLSQYDVKKMLIMKILRRIKQLKSSLGIQDQDSETLNVSGSKELKPNQADPRMVKARKEGNARLVELYESERFHPSWKVFLMFLTTGGVLTLTILKGGGHINPLDVHCGQALYWALTVGAIPWVLAISFIARAHLLKTYYAKEETGYEYMDEDVVWDEGATIKYPLVCSTAGLCAGMFGIGGGIVKGPLMLEMGVHPRVTSATSATMILFTSAGASVSYLLFQQLNLKYGMCLFGLGLFFTLLGQIGLNKLVKRYKRNSLIILIIGITVALSAVAMGIESSGALIDLFNGHAEGGGDICGAGAE